MTIQVADLTHAEAAAVAVRSARPSLFRRYPQLTLSPAILAALLGVWWLATDVLGVPA